MLAKYIALGFWMLALIPVFEMAKGEIYSSLVYRPSYLVDTVGQAIRAHEEEGVDLQIAESTIRNCRKEVALMSEDEPFRMECEKLAEIREKTEEREILQKYVK